MKITLGAAMVALVVSAQNAPACVMHAGIDYQDIFQADLDVSNYTIIRPTNETGRVIAEYARFDIRVRERLLAPADSDLQIPSNLTVTWDNSTFSEPEVMESKRGSRGFLIALRDPASALPPQRGPSAFIAPTPEPEFYTVFQAPCATAFIFEMDSLVGIALRQVLTTDRDQRTELQILSEFLFQSGADNVVQHKLWMERRATP